MVLFRTSINTDDYNKWVNVWGVSRPNNTDGITNALEMADDSQRCAVHSAKLGFHVCGIRYVKANVCELCGEFYLFAMETAHSVHIFTNGLTQEL